MFDASKVVLKQPLARLHTQEKGQRAHQKRNNRSIIPTQPSEETGDAVSLGKLSALRYERIKKQISTSHEKTRRNKLP